MFSTKKYKKRLDIAENFYKFWAQTVSILQESNVSIPPDQNMSQGAKCFNTPILYTTTRFLQNMTAFVMLILLQYYQD